MSSDIELVETLCDVVRDEALIKQILNVSVTIAILNEYNMIISKDFGNEFMYYHREYIHNISSRYHSCMRQMYVDVVNRFGLTDSQRLKIQKIIIALL
jgi:hypothetical protein